ncbi:268_t:CDS:2 [Entrophospora sp. SA101]|nr:268_t:CDS:2 [Entrophospora sp. SA101]
MACTNCGGNGVEYDTAAGHAFCTTCGFVAEESKIVSEVTFGESSSGAAILQGSYVGADQRRAKTVGPYRRHSRVDSREQTISNGALATALRLSDHLMEAAQRYFNLAITNNFIQGRKTEHVVAACLYIVCRSERTSHMLIDFSDILQVNVFTLGSTFLKLVRHLHIVLPLIDPSLYISRFASMLEFGEETPRVVADALRLVQRMDRDWLQTGRRPAGLLIAARMNNFRRSIREVIAVVKIADEFKITPSGKLSVQQFRNLWLEQECDPPAFKRAQNLAKLAKKIKESNTSELVSLDSPPQLPETSSQNDNVEQNDSNRDDVASQRENDNDNINYGDFSEQEDQVEDFNSNDNGSKEIDRELEEEISYYLDKNNNGEINSDVDDDEINNILLSEEEVRKKTEVWMELNQEFLQELEEKQKKQELSRQNGGGVSTRRKRQKKGKNSEQPVANTPAEAARRLFEERNLSKKINFDVLDSLLDNMTDSSSVPNTPSSWRDYDPSSISGSGISRSRVN